MAKKNKKPVVHEPQIVVRFNKYFGKGDLDDWQRLCRDVGLDGTMPSIVKCRAVGHTGCMAFPQWVKTWLTNVAQALKQVWVNIHDLVDAAKHNRPVPRFDTRDELIKYTRRTKKFYPLQYVKEMGPVRALLTHMKGA
jgi:hypothetical protein